MPQPAETPAVVVVPPAAAKTYEYRSVPLIRSDGQAEEVAMSELLARLDIEGSNGWEPLRSVYVDETHTLIVLQRPKRG